MATAANLPELPAPHDELAQYISKHPEKPMVELLKPYRDYEAYLRQVYAQDRQSPLLDNPHLNVLPLFNDQTQLITTRARNLATESAEEKSKYIMALPDDKRRAHGSPATVGSLEAFRKNFNVFSESSLVDLDWNNVVAAGSSVVNCLLPVPKEFNTTKRKLREYYHENFCPASDVDLFLYGLTHDEAISKIKQIEQAIRDALLHEVTVVRTKYAITIASQYPVRHVQIVLRVYKSISEILTGFDIDAAGGAYDGSQVYVTPRALGSFITQINHVDLSRRSPSYENRLSKYSHRNFEVHWPDLDRSRIDPTIFERSFRRTLGLARLLVLERLPTTSARETYLDKRRQERGRPAINRPYFRHLGGNIKESHEDEIADWVSEEDVSNYHTFTVPYGKSFHAKRIEKLCYTRDLLLNAEWNQPSDRKVYLHRHPAFFGRVADVVEDCCGSCPKAETPEEVEIAEKEAEIYISGKVSFLIDDPGRQQIGSFNPLTEEDWTDMAYVGNTARLCQSIVDCDLDDVQNWLSQDGADPNTRDYTGRTPLHLAVTASSAEIVKCLVDRGARITARLADGRTALHLAAARGDVDMIKTLMDKSSENEEAEEERQDRRRLALRPKKDTTDSESSEDSDQESDGELVDGATEPDAQSMATGSFVEVKKSNKPEEDAGELESEDEPDYYQIDVLAWDVKCSPLHLAIAGGHEEAVRVLCDYGADSILPVKFLSENSYDYDSDTGALLTLTLALELPKEKAKSMAQLLLKLGATSSQAETNGCTVLHRYVASGNVELIDTLLDCDPMGVKRAINHLLISGSWQHLTIAPLHTAIEHGDPIMVLKLLNAGSATHIDFDTWLKSARVSSNVAKSLSTLESNQKKYSSSVEQPFIAAIRSGNLEIAMELLKRGADPNALPSDSQTLLTNVYRRKWTRGVSPLDMIQDLINKLQKEAEKGIDGDKPMLRPGIDNGLKSFKSDTYQHWVVSQDIKHTKESYDVRLKNYEERHLRKEKTMQAKRDALQEAISDLKKLEREMVAKGAKTFEALYPDIKTHEDDSPYTEAYSPMSADDRKPYGYVFEFINDKDITEARTKGYIELMEAAWAGDIDAIKGLTLGPWGPNKDMAPLKMAIRDKHHHSPFSLAFLLGHHAAAEAILQIVKAQWSPKSEDKVRYKLETRNGDEDMDSEDEGSDSSKPDEPRIVTEKTDNAFTIDNLGEVPMQVVSHTKPVDIICECCATFTKDPKLGLVEQTTESLFRYALVNDDVDRLKRLLDLAQQYSGLEEEDENDPKGSFTFRHEDFLWAIQHGKVEMLCLIIKRTGAGIPLDHLVKKSGVELKQRPRFYQGLTVYGKKRKDWANAGRNLVVKSTGSRTPPLLIAALDGKLDSVEFFLSDKPHRIYAEFGKSQAGHADARLKHLMDSTGGFDRAISKWLAADNEYAIHCAVMSHPCTESNELLEYLVETCPSSIEKKTADGDTPLMMACRLGRLSYVKILVDADADQSTRNNKGENIIHAALAGNPVAHRLKPLLDSLDPELVGELFLQRRNLHDNGTTPTHTWIMQASNTSPDPGFGGLGGQRYNRYSRYNISSLQPYNNPRDVVNMLQLLLAYSKGEELEMLNGAGDTCLHTAIMHGAVAIVKVLADFKPCLVHRENAVGRTPAEIAEDRVKSQQFSRPRELRVRSNGQSKWLALKDKDPGDFVEEAVAKERSPTEVADLVGRLGLSDEYRASDMPALLRSFGKADPDFESTTSLDSETAKRVIWDLCKTTTRHHPGTRRLVSLNEANDVAKRLGERYTGSRYFRARARSDDDDDEEQLDDGEKRDKEENTVDFAAMEMRYRKHSAWPKWNQEPDGAEWKKCEECEWYHE